MAEYRFLKALIFIYRFGPAFLATVLSFCAPGRTGTEPPPAKGSAPRVISLDPEITQILYFLGAHERGELVGVTQWCPPPPANSSGEKPTVVGSILSPNWEIIYRLRPDYVFLYQDKHLPATIREFRRLSGEEFQVVVLDFYRSRREQSETTNTQTGTRENERFPHDQLREMRRVAGFFPGAREQTAQRLLSLENRVGRLLHRLDQTGNFRGKKIYIDFSSQPPPFYSIGGRTILGRALTRLGSRLPPTRQLYPAFSIEFILNWRPDFIVAPVYLPPGAGKRALRKSGAPIKKRWKNYLPGTPVLALNASHANRTGPALVSFLEDLNAWQP